MSGELYPVIYPRCAACGCAGTFGALDPTEPCPRCGVNAVVADDREHARFDALALADEGKLVRGARYC